MDNNTNNEILPNNEELFTNMFVLRIALEEDYSNELLIIKELKKYLLNIGYVNNINNIIYEFYRYYNINISLESIEAVPLHNNSLVNFIQTIFNQSDTELQSDNSYITPNNTPSNETTTNTTHSLENTNNNTHMRSSLVRHTNRNSLLNFISSIISTRVTDTDMVEDEFQDVLVTLDDEDIEKLKIIELNKDSDNNCSICLTGMLKNNKVIELNCLHTFHADCILKYLREYNYKCPVCRVQVGITKCHL
jgi:hypothetical protein